jgi:hypothetical protein
LEDRLSRLIEKIKQASQVVQPPIGFRVANKKFEKRRLLLVAEVKESVTAGVVEGADAVLLQGTVKNPPPEIDLPVGIRLYSSKADGIEDIDYIIFTMAGDEKMGKIMAVEASLEVGLLRALEDLPLDALFITGIGSLDITWQHLMFCKRIAAISTKPVLISVSPKISSDELQMLWEAGAAAVVVEIRSSGEIKQLRSKIDSLKIPSKKKRAIVPSLKEETTTVIREEEEEEE